MVATDAVLNLRRMTAMSSQAMPLTRKTHKRRDTRDETRRSSESSITPPRPNCSQRSPSLIVPTVRSEELLPKRLTYELVRSETGRRAIDQGMRSNVHKLCVLLDS